MTTAFPASRNLRPRTSDTLLGIRIPDGLRPIGGVAAACAEEDAPEEDVELDADAGVVDDVADDDVAGGAGKDEVREGGHTAEAEEEDDVAIVAVSVIGEHGIERTEPR